MKFSYFTFMLKGNDQCFLSYFFFYFCFIILIIFLFTLFSVFNVCIFQKYQWKYHAGMGNRISPLFLFFFSIFSVFFPFFPVFLNGKKYFKFLFKKDLYPYYLLLLIHLPLFILGSGPEGLSLRPSPTHSPVSTSRRLHAQKLTRWYPKRRLLKVVRVTCQIHPPNWNYFWGISH